MEASLIKMHFSQLVNGWKLSKYNSYSNSKKKEYQTQLMALYDSLKELDFDSMSDSLRVEMKEVIDFFLLSLEFLNHSTINNVPYELVECLRSAMKEWIANETNYITVTSYNEYSFDPPLVLLNNYYEIIKKRFGIEFKNKLVQINLPKYLENDYLCNTVLYHELGHFIDSVLNISDVIKRDIMIKRMHGIVFNSCFIKYFPYINDSLNPNYDFMLTRHVKEYFADLFASQYIKDACCWYLSYISSSNMIRYSGTHPSTNNRIDLVNDFISGKSNDVIDMFASFIKLKTSNELKLRSKIICSDDILDLIPCNINESSQLHSLFSEGWNIWIHRSSEFQHKNRMTSELKPSVIYRIINNLIEKSINNYIVSTKWRRSY